MSSVNKVILVDEYKSGQSIPELSEKFGLPRSTIRCHLKSEGVLRSRGDGVRVAAKKGRLGAGLRGKSRTFTETHKRNISKGRTAWGEENAAGLSQKPNGYIEHTRGEHKGRSEHVVLMEARIGRPLKPDECVHHIDGDRANNSENNLALMTRSGHARHHRMIERIQKCQGQ